MIQHHSDQPPDLTTVLDLLAAITDPVARAATVATITQVAHGAVTAFRAGHAAQPAAAAAEAPQRPAYKPHPLDVLIVAVLQEGAKEKAEVIAAVEGEKYPSGRRTIAASPSNIKKRVDTMAASGLIASSASGYIIADAEAVARLETMEFGG